MRRLFLLLSLSVAALSSVGVPRTASAQMYYYYFPQTFATYAPSYSPPSPRAAFDDRIDPHLVRAAHIAEGNAYRHSHLRCWRFVKTALLQSGAVDAYPRTNYACQAGSELVNHYGFVRLPIHDPYRAPVGAVIVYGGGGAGHVELRTEHGFASDYRSNWRCAYPVIGVYAKIS